MAKQVKGISKLNAAVLGLKMLAEDVREAYEEKRDWLDDKSEKYQESSDGEAWGLHLDEVDIFLDAIESLEEIDLDAL